MSHLFVPKGDAVAPALRGFARAHAELVELRENPAHLVARERDPRRVAGLVSGGGSGHEPLHAGFLGRGMLDAVAPGQVFASPHNGQVLEASRAAAGPEGVLHIVKNYTGDRINFGIAAERLRHEGIEVCRVLIDDDLATDDAESATGRRGTGATVVVEKLLGAAADEGRGLAELAGLGAAVAAASRSLAVASRAQTSPHTGDPAFELGADELEYGVGIHGERAATTIGRPPLAELLPRMVDELLAGLPPGPDDLLVLVNGLGATTQLELYGIFEQVADDLEGRGLRVCESLVGTFVPALDMAGFSLTLTRLHEGWREWWHAPARTPAFPDRPAISQETATSRPAAPGSPAQAAAVAGAAPEAPVLRRYAEAVDAAHGELTRLDQASGDGDFGDNLRSGLRRVIAELDSGGSSGDGFDVAGRVFLDEVGGTSGPLFGLLFTELAGRGDGDQQVRWARGAAAGLAAIQRVGEAEVGDRTLVDALAPAVAELERGTGFAAAARAAAEGAQGTAGLRARRGRASYVGDRARGLPDPGAVGVALLFQALAGTDGPQP
ncbi:dihydroxyacetone kinase family protein [Nonomuraea solani]|uniref:dihydroxyacetone kinase family protein n=1 Tax=Nonomuraea solani TaxID=1144553 RepID=UPI0011B01203|nr:dihydroxyacetone kinase family protein [Nonomuraea solani]